MRGRVLRKTPVTPGPSCLFVAKSERPKNLRLTEALGLSWKHGALEAAGSGGGLRRGSGASAESPLALHGLNLLGGKVATAANFAGAAETAGADEG